MTFPWQSHTAHISTTQTNSNSNTATNTGTSPTTPKIIRPEVTTVRVQPTLNATSIIEMDEEKETQSNAQIDTNNDESSQLQRRENDIQDIEDEKENGDNVVNSGNNNNSSPEIKLTNRAEDPNNVDNAPKASTVSISDDSEEQREQRKEILSEIDRSSSTSPHSLTSTKSVTKSSMNEVAADRTFSYTNGERHFPDYNDKRTHYCVSTNSVISSKYTWWNFIFLNLWEQFHNVANIYFLLVGVLQIIPQITTTDGIPSMYQPLAFIVAVSAIRAGKEDSDKHKADRKRNSHPYNIISTKGIETIESGEIRVGHIVKIMQDQMIPADCVVIGSSHAKGHCFIDKANLNGETRLEVMNSVAITRMTTRSDADVQNLDLTLTYEPPNKYFDTFRGHLVLRLPNGKTEETGVDGKVLMMRECILRNTEYVYGLVVYTGNDTKIQRSNLEGEQPKMKESKIMKKVRKILYVMLTLQFVLCFIGGVLSGVYRLNLADASYLYYQGSDSYSPAVTGILALFTWFILLSQMVPISLIVSSELVKFAQARMIQLDLWLYHKPIDKPAKCNTFTIHEDLGQVDYIFSDKTGTLTQNRMEFRYILLSGAEKLSQTDQLMDEEIHSGNSPHKDGSNPHAHGSSDQVSLEERAQMGEFGSKETDIARSVKKRMKELEEKNNANPKSKSLDHNSNPTNHVIEISPASAGQSQQNGDVLHNNPTGVLNSIPSPTTTKSSAPTWTEMNASLLPPPIPKDSEVSWFGKHFPRFMRYCWNSDEKEVGNAIPSQASAEKVGNIPSKEGSVATGNMFSEAEISALRKAVWGEKFPNESQDEWTERQAKLRVFLTHMALSNTVKPYEDEGEIKFQAESAEELAMVQWAHRIGFTKKSVNPTILHITKYNDDGTSGEIIEEMYCHLATFGFSSARARVTVIYQKVSHLEEIEENIENLTSKDTTDGGNASGDATKSTLPSSPKFSESLDEADLIDKQNELKVKAAKKQLGEKAMDPTDQSIMVCSKGQDSVMLPLISLENVDENALLSSLQDMSSNGLRTLVCAHSLRSAQWWIERADKYQELTNRDQSKASEGHPANCKKAIGGCEKCEQHHFYEEAERVSELAYIGSMGLEDQLQIFVPECIADCLTGGIRCWMVTGDKLDTAKNIGLACNLIDADMIPNINPSTAKSLDSLLHAFQSARLLEITGQWAAVTDSEEEIHRFFDSLDTDRNGYLEAHEVEFILSTLQSTVPQAKWEKVRRELLGNHQSDSLPSNGATSKDPLAQSADGEPLATQSNLTVPKSEDAKKAIRILALPTPVHTGQEGSDPNVTSNSSDGNQPTSASTVSPRSPRDRLSRQQFIKLMKQIHPTPYEAISFDIDAAIRTYNSIEDHDLYPVSMLVDRTAFQVMFPGPKNKKGQSLGKSKSQDSKSNTKAESTKNKKGSPSNSKYSVAAATKEKISTEEALELLRVKFFELAARSKSVVFARAEPAMKKRMVTEIRMRYPKAVTLAIGDGANDCDMIQAAHVGIGIAGVEGTAATNSADYAIGTFRMLHRLLFVHGVWSYVRISKLVNFIFYKAALLAFCMYIFGFYSAMSGEQFFNDHIYQVYNVLYTALPILFLALLDQPLPATVLQDIPIIYKKTKGRIFTMYNFFTWIGRAVIHMFCIYYFVFGQLGMQEIFTSNGHVTGLTLYSTVCFTITAVVPNLLILYEMATITFIHACTVVLSLMCVILVDYIINSPGFAPLSPDLNGVVDMIYTSSSTWLVILAVTILIMVLDLIYRTVEHEYFPSIISVYQDALASNTLDTLQAIQESEEPPPSNSRRRNNTAVSVHGKRISEESQSRMVSVTNADGRNGHHPTHENDRRERRMKTLMLRAILRFRNMTGGHFDSAAQAQYQHHDKMRGIGHTK